MYVCVCTHVHILNKSLDCKLQSPCSHVCYTLCTDHGCSLATSQTISKAMLPLYDGFSIENILKSLCMTSTLATDKDILGWQLLVKSKKDLAPGFFSLRYKMWPDAELTRGCWNKEGRGKSCPGEVIRCQMLPPHQTIQMLGLWG